MNKKLGCILLFPILTLFFVGIIACDYESMTEEERISYELSRNHEYKVMSVYQYIETRTNNFGGVMEQKLKYCFTYIGDDGHLYQFDGFEHMNNGLWRVCIGDENKYVVKEGFDTYRWLYLTEETLKNMNHK